VTKVIIVNADHLDVGYHGLIADVVNMYFDEFWPRAMRIAAELRAINATETYTCVTLSFFYPPQPDFLPFFRFVNSGTTVAQSPKLHRGLHVRDLLPPAFICCCHTCNFLSM
jgi:hypothetical protein